MNSDFNVHCEKEREIADAVWLVTSRLLRNCRKLFFAFLFSRCKGTLTFQEVWEGVRQVLGPIPSRECEGVREALGPLPSRECERVCARLWDPYLPGSVRGCARGSETLTFQGVWEGVREALGPLPSRECERVCARLWDPYLPGSVRGCARGSETLTVT